MIGYISNLPINIAQLKINFDRSENIEKLPRGPHNPNPGPILLKHAKTDEIVVSISKLSKDTNNKQRAAIIM